MALYLYKGARCHSSALLDVIKSGVYLRLHESARDLKGLNYFMVHYILDDVLEFTAQNGIGCSVNEAFRLAILANSWFNQ